MRAPDGEGYYIGRKESVYCDRETIVTKCLYGMTNTISGLDPMTLHLLSRHSKC